MSNSVQYLKSVRFGSFSIQEKSEIKVRGRPTPLLHITQNASSRQKEYTRCFNPQIYNKYEWLCGCEISNALFCFPCLLFGIHDDAANVAWIKKGVTDLKRLYEKCHKHEMSKNHVNNMLNFATLGSVNVQTCLSQAYRESVDRHNNQVQKNRDTLSKIINCIKFCGFHELALRGHEEHEGSQNQGVFIGLMKYTSEIDSSLKSHLESNSFFKGISKTIQNELLQCMLEISRQNILEEIQAADYVSVMADETTDISDKFQLVIVVRYCNSQGYPVERFWGFFNPNGQNSNSIAECIISELGNILKEKHKLIGQSFDGAAVMSGSLNGVQAKVREVYPNAYFVHCFAHQLNLTMERAARQNTKARIFFSNLSAIPAFFSRSPHRSSVLDSCVNKRIPTGSATRWNFKSRTVNAVHEKQEELKECFQILSESRTSSDATVNEASALLGYLQNSEFCFWLNFFHKIMPHVDILYNQVQSRQIDAAIAQKNVSSFTSEIQKVRDLVGTCEIEAENAPKRKTSSQTHTRSAAAKEVCDVILSQINTRFEFTDHLSVSSLLQEHKFIEYNTNFPEILFNKCVKLFPVFDTDKLRTELSVIYTREEFRSIGGAVKFLQFLQANNLLSPFSEVIKLLKIAITLPLTTCESERCFSTLKRIKTFLRNSMGEDRLSALAMLSIEKEMIENIPRFNQRVTNIFAAKKDRRMDFNFK